MEVKIPKIKIVNEDDSPQVKALKYGATLGAVLLILFFGVKLAMDYLGKGADDIAEKTKQKDEKIKEKQDKFNNDSNKLKTESDFLEKQILKITEDESWYLKRND